MFPKNFRFIFNDTGNFLRIAEAMRPRNRPALVAKDGARPGWTFLGEHHPGRLQ